MSTKDIQDRATEVVGKSWPDTTKTSAQIEDSLIKSRVTMLIKAPFFGSLATRLKFIDATAWCPTIATDGRNFYYNKHFVDALSARDGELEFGVGHEVLHCVYDHMSKEMLGDRDRRLANIAQDYVINADLVDAQIGKRIELVDICFDWKYRGLTWHEVYDQLVEDGEQGGGGQSFDMHLDGEPGEGDPQDSAGEGDNDGTNGPIKYSDEEKEQIKQDMQNAVVQAAKVAGAGNVPGGVKKLIDSLLNPQIDWRELLPQQIQSIIKSDYSFMRPSRKGIDAGFYLPGMDFDETVDIAIGLDVSGSISDDIRMDFLSEVKGVMDQYTNFKMHLWCYDTQVSGYKVFTENNMEEFMEYETTGGGGTCFDCNYDFMKEQGIQPKMFINFTDGYPFGSWGDESYCDSLFIVHGGHNGNVPQSPFGITVPYTREA